MITNPLLHILRDAGALSVGVDHREPEAHWGRGIRPTYLLYFVVKGTVQCGDGQCQVEPGQVLCVPPAVPKRLESQSEPICAAFAHLSLFEPWASLPSETCTVRAAPYASLLAKLIDALWQEVMNNTAQAAEAAENMNGLILHYMRRVVNEDLSPHTFEIRARLTKVWNRVNRNLADNWCVETLARLSGMSEGHLYRQVKRLFGKTPMQIIGQLRLEQAANLLRTTNLTLDRIASDVGYSSAFGLSNAFYRDFGVRPSSYRKGYSQEYKLRPVESKGSV